MSAGLGIESQWRRATPKLLRNRSAPTLVVGPNARWVEVDDTRIDLERRGAPRRILAQLCDQARRMPQETLAVDRLFEAGWPGESIRFESRVKRVHTAIWTLRKLGLVDVLHTHDRGYRLEAAIRFA